jgi:S1-C subfamily serine protease
MNLIDLIIILFLVSSVFRGYELGFVRQLFSTAGFFTGLLIGALLQPLTVSWVHTQTSRSLVTLLTTLGFAFLFLSVGEYVGILLKNKLTLKRVDSLDNGFGSGLALLSVLVAVWLSAAIILSLPLPSLQNGVKDSRIISALDRHLPPAPTVIADLGHLIDPNGFPQVFTGLEPAPPKNIDLPDLGDLQPAVKADLASVVKVEGQGCGGIVEGSGFVVADNLIVTNAHVVAGIRNPYVIDSNGNHVAAAVTFDPNLDLAVLRTGHLAGKPLAVNYSDVAQGTPGAVLGYPGGGNFSAKAAAVLDTFTALGRNIYGNGNVDREVYEIHADVIPGNSGGPLIAKDGSVIGVVFAESTTYDHVGYALTGSAIKHDVSHAITHSTATVSTGSCAQ